HGLAFDGAGTGDHHEIAAANLDSLDVDDGFLAVRFAAGELEGLEHGDDPLDAWDRGEWLRAQLRLVADHADDRALGSFAHVRNELQLVDPLENVIELLLGRLGFNHDNHGRNL